MDIFTIILSVLGLSLFEIISSIDNAIINAEVLTTMKPKARRWFLVWGIFSGVFLVRGLLPLLIVFFMAPGKGLVGAFLASFSGDKEIAHLIESSAPVLLMGGGVFLVFLFFHWIFLEEKYFGLPGERFIQRQGAWVYAIVPIMLLGNGLGAIVLRQLTISNIGRIKKYHYLKNGAMYSILFLGSIMILDSFGFHIPYWLSPLLTFSTVAYFFYKSVKTVEAK